MPDLQRPTKHFRKHELVAFFQKLYDEHEATLDPDHPRDFIDLYVAERQRVNKEGLTKSSFYGELGQINYKQSMADIFGV